MGRRQSITLKGLEEDSFINSEENLELGNFRNERLLQTIWLGREMLLDEMKTYRVGPGNVDMRRLSPRIAVPRGVNYKS